MLSPVYTYNLNHAILHGLATVAKCKHSSVDGTNPALVCATTGGKLFVHSPHSKNLEQK